MSGGGIAQDSGMSNGYEAQRAIMANIRSCDAAGRMFFATGNG